MFSTTNNKLYKPLTYREKCILKLLATANNTKCSFAFIDDIEYIIQNELYEYYPLLISKVSINDIKIHKNFVYNHCIVTTSNNMKNNIIEFYTEALI